MRKVIEESIMTSGDLINAVHKKIRVLEITEQTKVQNHTDGKKKLFPPLRF
jgi:hypothetical protein